MFNRGLLSNFLSYITAPLYNLVSSPTWFFSTPQKIFGLSIPFRVGIFTGLSLTMIVCTVGFLQARYPAIFGDEVLFVAIEKPQYWILIALLVLVFSIFTGFAVHFWLIDVPSRFPHLDRAWDRGISELKHNMIELPELPLFLILGVSDTDGAFALMQASGMKLVNTPIQDENQPLLWFTAEKDNQRSIFLFLCTCCQTSLLSGGHGAEDDKASNGSRGAGPLGTFDGAAVSHDFGASNSYSASYDQADKSQASADSMESASDFDREKHHSFGTSDDSGPSKKGNSSPTTTVRRLSQAAAKNAEAELQHVCRKLRTGRQPYEPCNGLIVTVPFQLMKAEGEAQSKALGAATRTDMNVMTAELELRPHVISLVHGMDIDEDFKVFVKRMLEFQSAAEVRLRLGKGLSSWSEQTIEVIGDVAHSACDKFQRLIYKFFASTQSLKKTDNGPLFRFLTCIRGRIEANLENWLVEGFAPQVSEGRARDLDKLPQFAGTYFSAAHPQSARIKEEGHLQLAHAHVPGIFERLFELMNDFEWTEKALARDNGYSFAASAVFGMLLLEIGIIVAVFVSLSGFWDNGNLF